MQMISFYTPPHESGGILWFHSGRPHVCPSVCLSVRISLLDDNLSKYQWIFIKHGMCIDILEIWFGNAIGQILSDFDGVVCLREAHIIVSRR